MKANLLYLLAAIAALLCTGCDGDAPGAVVQTPAAVTGVSLDVTDATLSPIETLQLTPTVSPAGAVNKNVSWSSSNSAVAIVNNDGLVTPVANGSATISVTTEDSGFKGACNVTVTLLGKINFITDKTWIVGDMMWSDAVTATGCKKTGFDGGTMNAYKSDCRKNINDSYGDLFSWEAVNQYKSRLCPDGWRVPVADDFCVLDMNLNDRSDSNGRSGDAASIANYTDESLWGGRFGGAASKDNTSYQLTSAYYWSQTSPLESRGVCLNFGISGFIYPNIDNDKGNGYTLRCVKDI